MDVKSYMREMVTIQFSPTMKAVEHHSDIYVVISLLY